MQHICCTKGNINGSWSVRDASNNRHWLNTISRESIFSYTCGLIKGEKLNNATKKEIVIAFPLLYVILGKRKLERTDTGKLVAQGVRDRINAKK